MAENKYIIGGITYNSIYDVFNEKIHPVLKKKILGDTARIKAEVKNAEALERYFQEIKTYALNPGTPSDFIDGILENLPPDIANNLFNYSNVENKYDLGSRFEQDIGEIVRSVFAKITGNFTDTEKIIIGANAAYPDIIYEKDEFKDIREDIIRQSYTKAEKTLSRDTFYRPIARQGKSDITTKYISSSTIVITENQKLLDFYNLLQNVNLSLKNYYIQDVNTPIYIKLGSTKHVRVFQSVISFIRPEINGLTKQQADKIVYASRYKSGPIMEHKKHVRFAFELMGPGLIYNGINLGECDYIIVNQRNGPGIRVFSTRDLLRQYFDDENSVYGSSHGKTELKIVFQNGAGVTP